MINSVFVTLSLHRSLLREDLSALRSLQSLLEKHEFGLKVDFGLVWFFLNFLKRNKTTYVCFALWFY